MVRPECSDPAGGTGLGAGRSRPASWTWLLPLAFSVWTNHPLDGGCWLVPQCPLLSVEGVARGREL